jgi:endo-alpha-1,4-polygalactosaminidase (GH114 family)
MSAIWLKAVPYIAALLLALGALYGAYHHGVSTTNATWKAEWNDRDTRDAQAKEQNEAAERTKEQSRQQAINKVVQNGQALIDTAAAAVTAANRESDRLRSAADGVASRIATSQAGSNSCTAAASAAATRAVMVLADVLKRADQRAGDLAGYADQSHGRGVTCEQAYDALGK